MMKAAITLLAFFSMGLVMAQQTEPVYEISDKMVKATYYHDNGEVAQVGYFVDRKPHGEWKMYNETGKKIAMGRYIHGEKTGKWFFWDAKGLQEVDYEDNRIANVVKWNTSQPIVLNK